MTVLVTGATGNIGRKVVDHLLAAGIGDVRALTVDPDRAALPAEVDVAVGRPASRRPSSVSTGCTSPPPRTRPRRCWTSPWLRGCGTSSTSRASPRAGGAGSRAVEASGIAWTHLWPGDFMENTFTWAPQIRATGTVREPWPRAACTPIAMDDVAAVAAVTLAGDAHVGRALSLTGPEVLTRVVLVEQLGAALGRELRIVGSSRDEAVAALVEAMGDDAAWYVDAVLAGFAENDPVPVQTVEEVVGRPATTFARWAAAHAGRFRH